MPSLSKGTGAFVRLSARQWSPTRPHVLTSQRREMSGIRRVALAGHPSAAATSRSPGQAVPIQVRGSSLFLGRLSRASGGMRIAPSTGASSGRSARSRAMRTASRRAPSSSTRPASSASRPVHATPRDGFNLGNRTLASSSDLSHEVVVDSVDGRGKPCPLVLAKPAPGSTSRPEHPAARCLW